MEEQVTMEAEESAIESGAVVTDAAYATEAVPKTKQKKPINQQKLQDNIWGWLFCLPLIVGTVWFVYVALILALLLSFTNYNLGTSQSMMEYLFSGGWKLPRDTSLDANGLPVYGSDGLIGRPDLFWWYRRVFTHTETNTSFNVTYNEMGYYLFNTVFYMIGIPIGMILSMFFAVCMSRDIKGGNVFRVLYYLPCVASTIAIVYTFKIMFKETGVINQILGLAGEDTGFRWMDQGATRAQVWGELIPGAGKKTGDFYTNPFWCQGIFTKLVIIIMSVWKGLGGTIILYVAGLSGVNAATKEAAQIDGANGWQIFWKVTMPDLYPVIFYNIVTSVIGGMQIYAEPVLLNNGESWLTSGYVSLIWDYGINTRLGNAYASAGAAYGMVLAVMIAILTLFQFWLDSRNKD